MRASYMGDALGDLVDSTAAIAAETVRPRTRTFSWASEPDYWQWDLTRENDHMKISIAHIEENEAFGNWHDTDEGRRTHSSGVIRFEAASRHGRSSRLF